jgi:hypothetical protein
MLRSFIVQRKRIQTVDATCLVSQQSFKNPLPSAYGIYGELRRGLGSTLPSALLDGLDVLSTPSPSSLPFTALKFYPVIRHT